MAKRKATKNIRFKLVRAGQRLAFRGKGSVRVKLPRGMVVWMEEK